MGCVRWALLALAASADGWWWNATGPAVPADENTSVPPWTERVFKQGFPNLAGWWEDGGPRMAGLRQWTIDLGEQSTDRGIWTLFDLLFSLVGWMLFGSAWSGVKVGCRRALQLLLAIVVCIVAHYVWALCWPVLSLMLTTGMACAWLVRKLVRIMGNIVYRGQRLLGGTPEAGDADFYGPGMGRTPETAELRHFKPNNTVEKWVVLKRDGMVAVFRLSGETFPIRSSGLYAGIDVDSLRGNPRLVSLLRGHDKVHLCRHSTCGEDGQHFQVYGLAKKFDPEKFQLQQACQSAKDAGTFLWGMASATTKRLADYGSESEPEAEKCGAHRVRWTGVGGEDRLSLQVCTQASHRDVELLEEDKFDSRGSVPLCAQHMSGYLLNRFANKCAYDGCTKFGNTIRKGVRFCGDHEEEGRSSRSSRSRSRERPREPQEPDGPAVRARPEPRGEEGLGEVRELLKEIKGSLGAAEVETPAVTPPRKVTMSRSPGRTPKSSIHRNLARIGMLDSPDDVRMGNLLEEFFDLYAETRDTNMTEADVRSRLADRHQKRVQDITRSLVQLALVEQDKGQKGLTKFIKTWSKTYEPPDIGEFPSSASEWSVVPSLSSNRTSPAQETVNPVIIEKSTPPVVIEKPSIFGQDRKAGAGASGAGEGDPMLQVAKALQNQTQEIAALVRGQHEANNLPVGTLKGLSRSSEELVYLLRACGQYDVRVCAGEHGMALAQALLSAQAGASTRLRNLGFRQKMTPRLAIGLAGPYWGTQDKHSLGAGDFIQYTDAELDAYASEARNPKHGHDQRPAPPQRLDDWEARVKRQTDTWCLLYGEEWREVKVHAATLLAEWHQQSPHRWPLHVAQEVWEELHWRFFEELKELLRQLKVEAKRESMTLQEIRFHALLPGPDGRAWLSLPKTFDLLNPAGWFKTEVEPRIERRQERILWRLTWEGGGRRDRGAQHAGGDEADHTKMAGGAKGNTLLGPKLSPEEVNRARDRAPVDKQGTLLCWGALTHQGCQTAGCQRSHEPLRGTFEALDMAVQMQLLRRGGLRRMKAETQETVTAKIAALRAAVLKDKKDKKEPPKRKAGEQVNPDSQGSPPAPAKGGEGRAGGERRVSFVEVPEEFVNVDYTKQEDFQDLVTGSGVEWGLPQAHQDRPHAGRQGESAPEEAKTLITKAKELAAGPVLGPLEGASDDLYAWAASRVAREPALTLESLLEEMGSYGVSDLAMEASELLSSLGPGSRAGEQPRLVVRDTVWSDGQPGQGAVELDGQVWRTWDYQEEVFMTEEIAALLQLPEPLVEKRQCVTKTVAAGALWRSLGRRPTMEEVHGQARCMRAEHLRLALEAAHQMGEPAEFVAPVEHELRVHVHDIVCPHHERDFRSLAVFPLQELDQAKLVVLRADYRGQLVVESVVGTAWQPGGWHIFVLIWKGHMVLMQPPDGFDPQPWPSLEEEGTTPSLGFSFYYHGRHDQSPCAPGRVACRLCKTSRRAGDHDFGLIRRHSSLASLAAVAGGQEPTTVCRTIRPAGDHPGLLFRELFAGKATLTAAWRQHGTALEPVECFQDPHNRQGYMAEHDLLIPEVRSFHLARAAAGPENVGWVAAPCTTYCDWGLQNGGTRSFAHPEGGHGRPATEKEVIGTSLSTFAADYFETMLDNGGFPIAESSAPSGRYPKQWDLPRWQAILARPDVTSVTFPMCAFGLKSLTEDGFYVHRTRLVFPKHPPLEAALARECPGVSHDHRHIPLKGSRPGSLVTRCTEAGVYCPDFVATIVNVVMATVKGGGQLSPRDLWPGKAGGDQEGTTEAREEQQHAPTEEDFFTAEGQEGAIRAPQHTEMEVEPVEAEVLPNEAEVEEQQDVLSEGDLFIEENQEETIMENSVDEEQRSESQSSGEHTASSDLMNDADAGDLQEELQGVWRDYAPPIDLDPARRAGAALPLNEAGFVQDQCEVSTQQGQVTIYHHIPRTEFFVPGGIGFPCDLDQLRNERTTRCMGVYQDGQTFSIEWMDNWRIEGATNPELPPWTGYTIFTLQGRALDGVDHVEEMEGGSSSEGTEAEGSDLLEDLEEEDMAEDVGLPEGEGQHRGRAGGSEEAMHVGADEETINRAKDYMVEIGKVVEATPRAWNAVREKGDALLEVAGGVEEAARALWAVREEWGCNNLKGVTDPRLDQILHPDHLAYMRDVEKNGMNARFVGERRRVEGSLHPNARRNVDQVYRQLMKDVKKGRILVVSQAHAKLGTTVSSPFEVVQKMLPDRSLSKDMRLVHDQRNVNSSSDKDWRPPALQPTHAQIVRRILRLKARFPGLPVLPAKKDIAGAFRLLWVDPRDVELFAGDLPWKPEEMEQGDLGGAAGPDPAGAPMTAIFLVSSFGFNGAPGEWTVFGRATEEWHRAHRPQETRRDGRAGFDSKILVDDNVLVEPWVGLRPWVSAECYEEGVRLILGDCAINLEKDAMEGFYAEEQCIWGLTINTRLGRAFLPERRILRGAHLIADSAFDPGQRTVTLKQMQQFRGIMTGWAVVVPSLRNELKIADNFLGGKDGGKVASPKLRGYGKETEEANRCWEDLWELFTVCRWLAARTETWAMKFGGNLPELLKPRERLSLPGAWEGVVFVTSDATPQVIGAVDWTFGIAARSTMEDLRPWLAGALEGEDAAGEGARIHLAEMLSLVGFLCERAPAWQGRLVLYGGDNVVVRRWVEMRQSSSRAGRLLIRVLNACEMRYRFQVVAGWWRTYHNETADLITRSEEDKFEELLAEKGWDRVALGPVIHQAVQDTQRFGACFLPWQDDEDRQLMMQLLELRVKRQVPTSVSVPWASFKVLEVSPNDRLVRDFEHVGEQCGATINPADKAELVIVAATLGVDTKGYLAGKVVQCGLQADMIIVEGPMISSWHLFDDREDLGPGGDGRGSSSPPSSARPWPGEGRC